MNIAIDFSPVERDPAGIGQYTLSLFSEACKIDNKNKYTIFTTTPFLFKNADNQVIRINKKLPAYGTRYMKTVSKQLNNEKFDLLISPSNHLFTGMFPRTLQYIHDLAPLHYPKFFGRKASLKYKTTAKLASSKALGILTISKTVKEEILEHFPNAKNKISYVYPGLNSWIELENKNPRKVLDKYSIEDKYIMTLGTLEPRKNHINMIKAYSEFKKKTLSPLKFVVVGKKGWYYDDIFKTVRDLGLEDDVKFLGYVPNQDLSAIYANAEMFVFMSFYEGFGIPPIEAMSLNIKTLVSDIPIFREAYKDMASYTDPHSPAKIATEIITLLDRKKQLTQKEIRTLYSWENSAHKLLSIINEYK